MMGLAELSSEGLSGFSHKSRPRFPIISGRIAIRIYNRSGRVLLIGWCTPVSPENLQSCTWSTWSIRSTRTLEFVGMVNRADATIRSRHLHCGYVQAFLIPELSIQIKFNIWKRRQFSMIMFVSGCAFAILEFLPQNDISWGVFFSKYWWIGVITLFVGKGSRILQPYMPEICITYPYIEIKYHIL